MKILFIIFIFLSGQYAFAMGAPFQVENSPISPEEKQRLNDMTETTSRTSLFSTGRGYLDQQHMEDKEMAQAREADKKTEKKLEKENKIETDEQLPISRPQMH